MQSELLCSLLPSLLAMVSVSISGSKKETLRGQEGRRRNGGEEEMNESSGGMAGLPTEVGVRCAGR